MTNWQIRTRGPVRQIVFEEEIDGILVETLECGHTKPVTSMASYYQVGSRACQKCLIELKSGERKNPKIDKPWSIEGDNVIHLDDYR